MDGLLTPFGAKIDPQKPLQEYPRPQMERGSFLCLNGPWQYAITREEGRPGEWEGIITVPFAPESALSGVGRVVQPQDFLWYRRTVTLPAGFQKDRVLLHFGGVDQCCVVHLNDAEVGRHDGGYLPFFFDVTEHLRSGENELVVLALDETDTAPYMRGPQKLSHGGRWHTPMSGIWQTVWMESLPAEHITDLRITPLYDEQAVEILIEGTEGLSGTVEVRALSTLTASGSFTAGVPLRLAMPGALSWHPRSPFLYTVKIVAGQDEVESYFGMRKFSVEKDDDGTPRLMLNNKLFFARGVIDQGLWPDGLYTPPGEEALKHDVRYAKRCGFNLIRKSGKIEPLRWYYHCDRSGLLVWQDLPGGGDAPRLGLLQKLMPTRPRKDSNYRLFGRESAEGRETFLRDADAVLDTLKNVPCLGAWVLFSGGYGQFDSAVLAAHFKEADPARLVDAASGVWDQGAGDLCSLHWPAGADSPALPAAAGGRAAVLAECGSIGLAVPGHSPESAAPTAARPVRSAEELEQWTQALWGKLAWLSQQGFCGFCLRQLSDCEDEADGLQSADRQVSKLKPQTLEKLNETLPP